MNFSTNEYIKNIFYLSAIVDNKIQEDICSFKTYFGILPDVIVLFVSFGYYGMTVETIDVDGKRHTNIYSVSLVMDYFN